MNYLKRFGVSSVGSFIVLVSYTFSLKLHSEINLEVFIAILLGALACCLVAGLLASAIVRKNPVVMLIFSQVLSIAMIGVVWSL
ncbi:hypothetical protein HF319_01890 [Xanthomonas sp. Kuri4-1]